MRLILLSVFVFATSIVKAHILLEHTYSKIRQVQVVNIEGAGHKYLAIDTSTNNVLLYNDDHSLWKRINTAVSLGEYFYTVSCVSSKFFETDDDIELAFTTVLTGGAIYKTYIYKEDGSVIKTLPNVYSCYPKEVNGKWKFIAHRYYEYSTDVYSCPGTYLSIATPITGSSTYDAESLLYPNPMGEAAMLKYTLPSGTKETTMTIYNMSGAAVRTLTVTDAFSEILINRGELLAGVYTYKLTGSAGVFSNDMFVIK